MGIDESAGSRFGRLLARVRGRIMDDSHPTHVVSGFDNSPPSGTSAERRVERVMGIEPTLVAWEATVLPLNYTRAASRFYAPTACRRQLRRELKQPVRFDLRDLELFVAVADAGSIARAAERSHTVASAVSKRISDLEESFGTPLLVRGAKGVELTAAGHALLARARVLLHQAAQLDDEMRRHASGARGYVRVFANISAIVEFLPRALASFAAQTSRHSRASGRARELRDRFRGRGQLGGLRHRERIARDRRSDDRAVPQRRARARSCNPRIRSRRTKPSPSPKSPTEPFVGLHAGSSLHRLLTRAATEAGTTLNWRIHVTSFDAACAMVAAGLGVSIVPRAATTAYIRSLSLVSRTVDGCMGQASTVSLQARQCDAAFHRNVALRPPARAATGR